MIFSTSANHEHYFGTVLLKKADQPTTRDGLTTFKRFEVIDVVQAASFVIVRCLQAPGLRVNLIEQACWSSPTLAVVVSRKRPVLRAFGEQLPVLFHFLQK